MKKLGSLLLVLCMLATLLVACGKKDEHHFSSDWSTDADSHWHACTDEGCTEVADKAAHTWDSGVITTPATKNADGTKTFTCTDCGYTKTESTAYVMDRKVSDRVYSLLGEENEGAISVSLNKDGMMLMLTSHDCDLELDDEWGDIAIFEYNDNGKMTAIKAYGESVPISEYDASGRPTKVGEGDQAVTVFTYEENNITFTLDGNEFCTFDQYGRLVKYEEKWETYHDVYTLTFEGNVGTWSYNSTDEEDDVYSVVYENNTRMVKEVETRADGTVSYYYEFQYSATGLPVDTLFIEDPDDSERREGRRYVYEYDAEDRMTKMIGYMVEGTEETKAGEIHYTYGENGELATETQYGPDGTQQNVTTYTYDANANLIKEESISASGSKYVNEIAYNENGKETADIRFHYNSDGTLREQNETRYEYHANGMIAKETRIWIANEDGHYRHEEDIQEYREDGMRWRFANAQYDENGNKMREGVHEYYADGTRSREERFERYDGGASRYIFEYRQDGTRAKETNVFYDTDGNMTEERIFEYYADGDHCSKMTTVYYTDGVESSRSEVRYDENGNQIS